MRSRRFRNARGVALLIVLVVLVLIATLATEIAITAKTGFRLADHSMEDLLLRTAVDGRVEILKAALRFDAANGGGYDTEADDWSWHKHEKLSGWGERGANAFDSASGEEAASTAQFKNTDVELTAWCEDECSKLNLRGLMKQDENAVFQQTRETLIRLIDLVREEKSSLDISDGDAQEMVDDLVKWLRAEADSDENPMPDSKPNRGRLQSVDDLLRVPGGRWTLERLYDVKDPDLADEEPGAEAPASADEAGDSSWERSNGVRGLARYLTVFAEDAADPAMQININTAPAVLLKALLEPNEEELADKIVEHRRVGADDDESTSGTSPGAGTASGAATQGFFKLPNDLTKVEGFGDTLDKYPRLKAFAVVKSSVYSLRIIATTVHSDAGADEEADAEGEKGAPKEVKAIYDYREVVQRTTGGFLTLFAERRNDPLFDR